METLTSPVVVLKLAVVKVNLDGFVLPDAMIFCAERGLQLAGRKSPD